MKPEHLSTEKLIEFSREHVYYEFDMLLGVCRILHQEKLENVYVCNALLESFVLHASVILDFFYNMPMNPYEAKAIHYVQDPKAWEKALPAFDRYLVKFNKKRNREVMHLSYERLLVLPYDKKWNSKQLLKQLSELLRLFLRYADPSLLDKKIYSLKEKL